MKISRSNIKPTQSKLIIDAGFDDLIPIKNHVLGHFKKSVKVPGFRPGKAPSDLIEKHLDKNTYIDEFLEHAINELYRKAVQSENIRPVGDPEVKIMKFVPFSNLEIEITVQNLGSIKLPDYKKIKITKPKSSVTAKEIDEIIERLRIRSAERIPSKEHTKKGDEVVINFKGLDQAGKPVSGAEGKNYPLIIGSGNFIPGFEENLVGLKEESSKKFNLTFPEDYGMAALKNQKINFEVTINKVYQLKKPPLDSDFAKKIGPFKTFDSLRKDIKNQLMAEKQQQIDRNFENEVVEKITDQSEIDIPDVLINEQVLKMEESEKRELNLKGQTWQEHLKQEGVTEDQHRDRNKPDAQARVKAGLVLSEIANYENIDVTPEELEIRIQMLKGQYKDPQAQEELNKPEVKQEIVARLLTEKTVSKLISFISN